MTNPKHTDTSRSGDPVAWMYEYGGGTVACTVTRYEPAVLKALGYTETPLYPADRIEALEAENERLHEELAAAYIKLSGTVQHASDCATSNAPAMKPGPCDCKENAETFARSDNV